MENLSAQSDHPIRRSLESGGYHGEEGQEEGEEGLTDARRIRLSRCVAWVGLNRRVGATPTLFILIVWFRSEDAPLLFGNRDVGRVGMFHSNDMIAGIDVVNLAGHCAR